MNAVKKLKQWLLAPLCLIRGCDPGLVYTGVCYSAEPDEVLQMKVNGQYGCRRCGQSTIRDFATYWANDLWFFEVE